jgi:hypothetical protein
MTSETGKFPCCDLSARSLANGTILAGDAMFRGRWHIRGRMLSDEGDSKQMPVERLA